MSNSVEVEIGVEPSRVFAVLADGWSYPNWVIGVTHVRNVDANWPAIGSRLHHTLGMWPLTGENYAEVIEIEAGRKLVLRIHLGKLGRAHTELTVRPAPGGSAVTLTEHGDEGFAKLVPKVECKKTKDI